jgi:hypothetical protein
MSNCLRPVTAFNVPADLPSLGVTKVSALVVAAAVALSAIGASLLMLAHGYVPA